MQKFGLIYQKAGKGELRISNVRHRKIMHNQYDFNEFEDISLFNMEIDMLAYSQQFLIQGLNLKDAYDNYYGKDNKVYYMAIDLKLNLYHIFSTLRSINRTISRFDLLSLVDFHRHWINFIALYRSFYDKFMNLVITVGYPDDCKSFDSSTSKNKKFKKILLNQPTFYIPLGMVVNFPEEFTMWTYNFINFVNEQYRTPELHGSGTSRKWVFQNETLEDTPFYKVHEFVDHMGQFSSIICCIFSGKSYAEDLKNGISYPGSSILKHTRQSTENTEKT